MLRRTLRIWPAGVLLLALPLAASDERLARARRLLDEGRPVAAAEELAPVLRKDPDHAEALLLRSTARFMEGLSEEGRADLERALASDPTLRQAWLNRAGLDIAEERYEAALEALERARGLDLAAPDNHLNLGAVLLLLGRLEEATGHFERYLKAAGALEAAGAAAEAHYLVATNYAGQGFAGLAVESLRRAIELDEAYRLAARTDPNFLAIAEAPELRRLLETDLRVPGQESRIVRNRYPVAYAGGDGPLLSAVLEALRLAGERFDPRIEVTPVWALVHGNLRVKLYDTAPGAAGAGPGTVEVTAL
ncbi:MAG TPA: tetratricopeptide repeat protein, partial [Thermoanaerobaculia bacterium]|nr:tetratricopeptide repeat protein [Thermoanaerobaculia bacterium]